MPLRRILPEPEMDASMLPASLHTRPDWALMLPTLISPLPVTDELYATQLTDPETEMPPLPEHLRLDGCCHGDAVSPFDCETKSGAGAEDHRRQGQMNTGPHHKCHSRVSERGYSDGPGIELGPVFLVH